METFTSASESREPAATLAIHSAHHPVARRIADVLRNCSERPGIFVLDDLENIEIVGSGKIEVIKASFEDCLLAHPSGIAWKDWGKLLFWDLKDPNAPPVPGPDSLREKLAAVQRS